MTCAKTSRCQRQNHPMPAPRITANCAKMPHLHQDQNYSAVSWSGFLRERPTMRATVSGSRLKQRASWATEVR